MFLTKIENTKTLIQFKARSSSKSARKGINDIQYSLDNSHINVFFIFPQKQAGCGIRLRTSHANKTHVM